jgi:23S rRNA (pseudouridine1915-N3)-methyltransferase
MKIKLICIGKTGKSFLVEGEQTYLNRLKHYLPLEKVEIPDLKNAKKLSKDQIKVEEGKLILDKTNTADHILLLDENGKTFSSEKFAVFIEKQFHIAGKTIVFVIGGAYGFSDEIYSRANGQISISSMTFSHQMIRMIFLEQLYRAMTILKGEPYHHS